jgi:enterochelin esterase-like enzyme
LIRASKESVKRGLAGILFLAIGLSACAGRPAVPPSPAATATFPPCDQDGTIGSNRAPAPTQGFDLEFDYYLPPCYDSQGPRAYPVLYLITLTSESRLSATDNTPMSLANRLIRSGELPAAIVVVPDPIIGYGSDAALTLDLVPYVDSRFRTLPDARHRGVGGISHGAALAARMAFQFPETFGSAGLLSGGIDPSEEAHFTDWIARTPSEQRPRVIVYVGDQDGIRSLTDNLLEVLDANKVPYTLNVGPGGHAWAFWSSHMQEFLLWFAAAW